MPRIISKRNTKLQQLFDDLDQITLDDLRECIRLVDLVDADGGRCPLEVMADQPVWVGTIALYMPTLGAMQVLERTVEPWFGDDPFESTLWTAWILEHSRQPRILQRVKTRAAALKRVDRLTTRCGATYQEIAAAVTAAMQGFPEVASLQSEISDHPQRTDDLTFVAKLLEAYGGTLHRWVWQESAQRCLWIPRALSNVTDDDIPDGRLQALRIQQRHIAALRAKYLPQTSTNIDRNTHSLYC